MINMFAPSRCSGTSENFIQVDLDLYTEFCNAWPEIEICANGLSAWQGFVVEKQRITVQFVSAPNNVIKISYLNKRQGPDIWDTKMDLDGKILQDQHCIIKGILINSAKCDWIIHTMLYNYPDRPSKATHGFMDAVGHAEFCFPADVYGWILDHRTSISPTNTRISSLDYKNIYMPQHENERALQMIDEAKKILNKFND